MAACGGTDAIPDRFPAKTVDRHCKEMSDTYAAYHKAWADPARKFIGDLRPADAPKTVVYPFGGGDLVSALVVYPDATEITTISLEAPGDVRAIDTIDKAKLAARPRHDQQRHPPPVPVGALDDQEPAGRLAPRPCRAR